MVSRPFRVELLSCRKVRNAISDTKRSDIDHVGRSEQLPSLEDEKALAPPFNDRPTDGLSERDKEGLLPSLDGGWQQGRSRDQTSARPGRQRRSRGFLQGIRKLNVVNVDHDGLSMERWSTSGRWWALL